MMAPGLPNVAQQYGITNPTIIALTLSIFLLSFALGVKTMFFLLLYSCTDWIILAFVPRSSVRDVWTNLGLTYRQSVLSRFQSRLCVFADYWILVGLPFPE